MNDEEIEETALQAISETPFVSYQYIDSFLPQVAALTLDLMET